MAASRVTILVSPRKGKSMWRLLGYVARQQDEKIGWQTLKNGYMLVVERDTLKTTIHSIAHNARSSIQEQYLSQLQR